MIEVKISGKDGPAKAYISEVVNHCLRRFRDDGPIPHTVNGVARDILSEDEIVALAKELNLYTGTKSKDAFTTDTFVQVTCNRDPVMESILPSEKTYLVEVKATPDSLEMDCFFTILIQDAIRTRGFPFTFSALGFSFSWLLINAPSTFSVTSQKFLRREEIKITESTVAEL